MFKAQAKKGIVLLVVLGMVLMVAILAQVILRLILSHNRFTHHQTSRIQAYYASMAGVNFAMEALRSGTWPTPAANQTIVRSICSSGCNVTDTDFPPSIGRIDVTISGSDVAYCDPPGGTGACVASNTTYTYTSP